MTHENKQLLLADLCARLPYKIIIKSVGENKIIGLWDLTDIDNLPLPYLRPISSMTEEERKEYKHLVAFSGNPDGAANFVDWLNKKMFDYHTDGEGKTMIEKGLALEAPDGMYNLNNFDL